MTRRSSTIVAFGTNDPEAQRYGETTARLGLSTGGKHSKMNGGNSDADGENLSPCAHIVRNASGVHVVSRITRVAELPTRNKQ